MKRAGLPAGPNRGFPNEASDACPTRPAGADSGAILAATGMDGPSVVQVRTRGVFPDAIFPPLSRTLRLYAGELERGALVIVDSHRARVRILPLKR